MIRWLVFIGIVKCFSAITSLIGYIFGIDFYKIGEFLGSSKPLAIMTIIGWVVYSYFIYWLAGYLLKNN